jgi:hypothetical protein
VREEDQMLDRVEPGTATIPSFTTPGMARAVELSRELLTSGYSEDENEEEESKPTGSGVASF